MNTARTAFLIVGIIALIVAVGTLFIGGLSVWGHLAKTDDDGFLPGDTADLVRDSHAIVVNSDKEIVAAEDDAVSRATAIHVVGRSTSKVEASNNNPSKEIFIGIGKDSDVESYLSGIEYYEMRFLVDEILPSSTENRHLGSSQPANPRAEAFWIASTYGSGTQTVEWDSTDSDYSIVLMNADGSAGVNVSAATASKSSPSLLVWGVICGLVGVVALTVGITLVYLAAFRRQTHE